MSIIEYENETTWAYTLRTLPRPWLVATGAIAGRYAYPGGPEPSRDELVALAKIVHKLVYRELHRRRRKQYPKSGYDNNTILH